MANSTKDSRHNVSLEELLRFKRTERPDEVFWEQFDSELHDRMMQTLVKKDPWLVQLMRGLSGRMARTTGIVAAAALLALMVVRPALVAPDGQGEPAQITQVAQVAQVAQTGHPALAGAGNLEAKESPAAPEQAEATQTAEADYNIEVLSLSEVDGKDRVTREYGLDDINVASYDSTAYSADTALSGFTSAGVASIVY